MFTSLQQLLYKIIKWYEDYVPDRRKDTNDADGRKWFAKAIDYNEPFKLEKLRKITDREKLNTEYVKRFEEKDVQARKGISALKIEISALYSFNKCAVQRWKGRMHFYRDDLSQKGARNPVSVGQSYALFDEFKKNLDN